jgi:hypothetical protein
MTTCDDSRRDLLFCETQRFSLAIRLIVLVSMVVSAGIGITAVLGSISKDTTSKSLIAAMAVIALPIAIVALLLAAKLETQVRNDGLYVRLFPLHLRFRKFTADQIDSHYPRQYNPLLEYGGWGIRCSLTGKSKAYNARGNLGVQLELAGAEKLLIGSQKPYELDNALSAMIKTSHNHP